MHYHLHMRNYYACGDVIIVHAQTQYIHNTNIQKYGLLITSVYVPEVDDILMNITLHQYSVLKSVITLIIKQKIRIKIFQLFLWSEISDNHYDWATERAWPHTLFLNICDKTSYGKQVNSLKTRLVPVYALSLRGLMNMISFITLKLR